VGSAELNPRSSHKSAVPEATRAAVAQFSAIGNSARQSISKALLHSNKNGQTAHAIQP